jgi:3-deoxy-D-manno-octulosonic-acid transferase
VLLVDTTGELMHFTGLADRVFIGKSLFRGEGQNPIEAAYAGVWLCTGPGMDNFRAVMQDLRGAEAVCEVEGPDQLLTALRHSLENPDPARAQGQRARELVEQRKGVIVRSAEALEEVVGL